MARTRKSKAGIPDTAEVKAAAARAPTEAPPSGSRQRIDELWDELQSIKTRLLGAADEDDTVEGARSLSGPAAAAAEEKKLQRQQRIDALWQELQELRRELGSEMAESAPERSWLDPTTESGVRSFVEARRAQMEQRKYQLSLIKSFIDDPSRFGLDSGDIPTSTSPEEFAERRSELEYRIATVKTFLGLLNEELRQLKQAEAYAQGKRRRPARQKGKSKAAGAKRKSATT